MTSSSFERIWNERLFVYDPSKALERQMPCPFATAFQAWIDSLFEKHLDGADRVRLNQLKLLVQDKFFELRTHLPNEHRNDDGRDPDHPCVFSVFEQSIAVLHEHELNLEPPPLTHPAPPALPPKPPKKRRGPLDKLLLGDEDPEFGS